MSIPIRYLPATLKLDSIQPHMKILFKKQLINNFYHKVSILSSLTALVTDIIR